MTHLQNIFLWAKCTKADSEAFKTWTLSNFNQKSTEALLIQRCELVEGLSTGLSRAPSIEDFNGPTLGDFAKVLRGIATSANEFFFLTRKQATSIGIPKEFLLSAIGRTRDVPGEEITFDLLNELGAKDRPTQLFSPDGRTIDHFPASVREYLKQGEKKGIHRATLISTRRPWYKMEVRPAPPILFAYLGRRNARFIRNYAGVVPLTGFLCVYPHQSDCLYIDKLWAALRHPATITNLSLVGKSYGSGAIKVEPRALERLPIPNTVVTEVGLREVLRTPQLLFT